MPPSRQPAKSVMDTSTAAAVSCWHSLLALQVELFAAREFACLDVVPGWHEASRVLDVGCGNGDYLARLAAAFPGKRYVGIDLSEDLIGLARRRHASRSIAFELANIFDYEPKSRFDMVLMRFVVQHLSDLPGLLARTSKLLSPGGEIVIVEPDIERSANLPGTPRFMAMLAAFAEHAAAAGRLRSQLDELPALIAGHRSWRLAGDERLVVDTAGPLVGTKVLDLYARWIDVCEQSGAVPFAYDAVRREIDSWGRHPQGRSRVVLRMLRVRRADASSSTGVTGRGWEAIPATERFPSTPAAMF